MAEVLPILTNLSETFQKENLDFGSVKPALARVEKGIATLKISSIMGNADWQINFKNGNQEKISYLVVVKDCFSKHSFYLSLHQF